MFIAAQQMPETSKISEISLNALHEEPVQELLPPSGI
jgi:hypothetical protein